MKGQTLRRWRKSSHAGANGKKLLVLPVALFLLLLSVQAAIGAQTNGRTAPNSATLNRWTNLYPDLQKVSAVSATDAWAVGYYGQLLHYTGGNWAQVDVPALQGLSPTDIDMASATDGWIAAGYRAFHYDGSAWTEMSSGLGYGVASVFGIAAVAPNDAWGVGFLSNHQALLHWDGTSWNPAGPIVSANTYMDQVVMSGSSEGWVIGQVYVNSNWQGLIYHYDGTSWSQFSNPFGTSSLRGLWASADMPGEAWVTGGDTTAQGAVYHYAQGSWHNQPIQGSAVPGSIYMQSPNEGWATTVQPFTGLLHWNGTNWATEYTSTFYLKSVTGAGGQVWSAGNGGTLMSRSGGAWSHTLGSPTVNDLTGVSAIAPNDAWAVGANGTTLHYNGDWTRVSTGFSASLYDVQMLASNDVDAVGAGVIEHWDGAGWSQVGTPRGSLRGISMLSADEGWAVGDAGLIWRDSAGSWSAVSTNITRTLNAVAMDSASHGWAVGGDMSQLYTSIPALLEYTGGQWVDRSATLPPGSPVLHDIVLAPGGQEGWAVGATLDNSEHNVLHLLNGTWSTEPNIQLGQVNSVAILSAQNVWAIGSPTLQYTASGWARMQMPTSAALNGVTMLPGWGGWAVGSFGTILRYDPLDPPTPTATSTPSGTNTPMPPTLTPVNTNTPAPPTLTPAVTASPVPCLISFSDVSASDYFYNAVRYLYCRSAISGYGDNTFRPYNYTTRAQLAKIVVLAEGWTLVTSGGPHFSDVLAGHPFYAYIETAYSHSVIGGYSCGGQCLEFRPGNNVTRAQLAKIVVRAQAWAINTANGPHFSDVPTTDPFYGYVETAYNNGIISGYANNTFLPGNPATRGQIAKIVYSAVTHP